MNWREKSEAIAALVRSCGRFIREADRSQLGIDAKGGHANFVTTYDKLVQDQLKEGLSALVPEARFVGEEGSDQAFSPQGLCFIVDPIDGTQNFIKDLHHSCVSVALVADGEAVIGVIYNPYTDELFSAVRGEGAFCNGRRLAVSSEPLENGVVIFGTAPYYPELAERTFRLAAAYLKKALDVRRTGSAALDLCAIAAGRAELFFELYLSPWDYAAGGLLVREAGGTITDDQGCDLAYDHPCAVFARGTGVKETKLD